MVSHTLLLGVGIFIVYWVVVAILNSKKILEKHGITAYGPILMIKTEKGLELIDKIGKKKRFWRLFANAGIPAVFAGMIFMFVLIILMDIVLFTNPPPPSEITNPKNILLIPGVNDWIPFEWGVIGLLVTLVVHEFSHAILCRVEGVKVKAMGIILALVPIGGFAEPDEGQLMSQSVKRIQRIRIFSAGVISNFIVAIFAFSLFFYLINFLSPTVSVIGVYEDSPLYGLVEKDSIITKINGVEVKTPEDMDKVLKSEILTIEIEKNGVVKEIKVENLAGPRIVYLLDGYPAKNAGLKEGMIIYSINGERTYSINSFFNAMKKTKPEQVVEVVLYSDGKFITKEVKLTKHPNYDSGFLGVSVEEQISGMRIAYSSLLLDWLKSIPDMLSSPKGLFILVSMPLNFRGFGEETSFYFLPQGFWEDKGETIFYLLNTLYWIGWINFYVGLFNCLPAIPLDGGRVFHETMTMLLSRKYGDRAEKISMNTGKVLAILVFASIILSIVIPNLQLIRI
ncbi:hypothetical protein Asulf_00501 [Archaeoglobus sulfaticallidus PM70-1]|uniref:Peptidase M50 domain-containing protein n=1 Tax=Archaeoglobus sulfaticallidus PM70-1 TaxID=387631 RepID=N0BAB4_9EURY|nr:site-2 protease family protein [Archaeoglobus sulfaticallidus]AGK60524.1 hypothetical protein Asulf_00501 [Archaeoglobus sulfaticallidus PM70-1]